MEYFAILVGFLTLIGFWGTAFAQYVGNSEESGLIWPPVCIGGSGMCPPYDQWIKEFFSNVISEPFEKSDTVVVGTVIQVEKPNSQSIKYSIDVEFYLKNTQSFDSISATLDNPVEPETFPEVVWYNSPVFKKGDLAFVYLKKMDGAFKVLPQSFAIDKHEVRGPPPSIILQTGPDRRNFEQGQEVVISGMIRKAELYNIAKKGETMDVKITIKQNDKVTSHGLAEMDSAGNYNYKFQTAQMSPGVYDVEINFGPQTTGNRITIEPNLKYWTPLKQFKSGISIDEIQCKENLVLMQNRNGSPACVKPESIPKLIERGWALQTELSIDSTGVGYNDSKCNALDELNFEVFHCPAIAAPTKMTMIQVTGLNICKKENEDVGYTLKPGESGVFTYTVYRGMDTNWPPTEPEYKEILVEPLFLHEIPWEQGMSRRQFVPEGIDVEYQSDLPKLGFNQTATVNVTVSVEPNTPRQVLWLGLPPFTCNGGAYVKFAIVD